MADYSQPFIPNVSADADAAIKLRALFDQQQKQQAMQQAGQLYASDPTAARNMLMGGGQYDAAAQMQKILAATHEQELNDRNDTIQMLARSAATYGNDPDKWKQITDLIKARGGNVSGLEDYKTGPGIVQSLAQTAQERFNNEMSRRKQELAETQARINEGQKTTYLQGPEGSGTIVPFVGGKFGTPIQTPQGVNLENKVDMTPEKPETGRGGGDTALVKNAKAIKAAWDEEHPDAEMPLTMAQRIAEDPRRRDAQVTTDEEGKKQASLVNVNSGQGASFSAAKQIQDENTAWNKANPGLPPRPTDFQTIFAQTSKRDIQQQQADTRAKMAAAATSPELQRELAEYRDIGKRDGALAGRKAIAGGALNHLETVSQISDADLENALGVIKGSGGYQKFADALHSGRIENSVAYRNAKQTLAVLLRETQNAYHIAGTGADTDARLKETSDALSPDSFLQSPNVEVFRQRLNNLRAILQGVINSPRPSAFGSREPGTAGSAASEAEVRRVSGEPEVRGQVPRTGQPLTYNPVTRRAE